MPEKPDPLRYLSLFFAYIHCTKTLNTSEVFKANLWAYLKVLKLLREKSVMPTDKSYRARNFYCFVYVIHL